MTAFRFTHVLLLLLSLGAPSLHAAEPVDAPVSRSEFEELKRQLTSVQAENGDLKSKIQPINDSLAKVLDSKAAPQNVVSKVGKLTVSGLLQIWYYTIQNDRAALFDDHRINDITDTNEASDNDSFRIRRAQLRFTADLSKQIQAVVMLDPARDANSYPSFPTNQGLWKRTANSATGTTVTGVQTGTGGAARLLQDVYILYKEIIPHHDFQVGEFKPPSSEESAKTNSQLDFAERSFIGQLGDNRDLGAQVRGYWFEDRLQYWIGAFDAAGNLYGSGGQQVNRSDDNDQKDLYVKVLGRPLWKHACWGSLELGGGIQAGIHGESGSSNIIDHPVNGLNRQQTRAYRISAFGNYEAAGDLKGLWVRGEWARIRDRNQPSSVIDLLNQDVDGNGTQDKVDPFTSNFWYASIGYKLGEGPCAKSKLPTWAQNLEMAFRFENIENVQVANLIRPEKTDVFKTRVYTAGVNYYVLGNNAKFQFNYNHVSNPDGQPSGGGRFFHPVQNDSLVVNFQVAF